MVSERFHRRPYPSCPAHITDQRVRVRDAMWMMIVAATGLIPMVRDQVTRSLLSLNSDDSLKDAARLLKRSRITGAPCYDDNSLDGILSRRDLLKTIAAVPEEIADDPGALEQQMASVREQTSCWEVMTNRPQTISPDVSLIEAARILAGKKLNRLIVKSKYSPVLGIISSTDVVFSLLGCGSDKGCGIDEGDEQIDWTQHVFRGGAELDVGSTGVAEHMATDLLVVSPELSLEDAARVLKEGQVTGAPVMEADTLVGVLSRNDLLKALAAVPDDDATFKEQISALWKQPVSSVMSNQPRTITPDTSVYEASKIMVTDQLNRLLVTNAHGKLCGIVSSTDVVFAMLGGDEDEENEVAWLEDADRFGHMQGHMQGMY